MKKRIRVLFDASVIANGAKHNSGRTGIFFAAYNVLKEFIKRDDLIIELYSGIENYTKAKSVIENDEIFRGVKFTDDYNFFGKIYNNFEDLKYRNKVDKRSLTARLFIKLCLKFFKILHKIFKISLLDISKVKNDYDIYFTPLYAVPECLREVKNIKKFMMIHDVTPLIFPQYFAGVDKGKYFFFDIIKSINKNDYYFSNSEYTKQDFIKYVPRIDGEKITTAYLAASEDFRLVTDKNLINPVKTKYNIPADKKYLFSLCSLEPRKNLIRAVKSFIKFIDKHKIENLVYVLGGSAWDGFVNKLEQEIPDYTHYKNQIIKAGYVEDEDLPLLYSGAEFFVYTSEYEGFGLPVLEAMKCGRAVITSNNSSLPEVAGNAAIQINFDSIDEHVKAYEKLYFNNALRNEYSEKAILQAAKFSWHKTAETMIDTFKKVL